VAQDVAATETVELRIEENGEKKDGLEELSRLTAEFESFVRSSQDDIDKEDDATVRSSLTESETTTCNVTITETVEVHRQQSDDASPNTQVIVSSSRPPEVVVTQTSLETEVIELKIQETKSETPEPEITEIQQITTQVRQFPEIQRINTPTPTPTPSREETPDYIPMTVREKFHVLRIEESDDVKPIQKVFVEAQKERSLPPEPQVQVATEVMIVEHKNEVKASPTLQFEQEIKEKSPEKVAPVSIAIIKEPSPIPRKRSLVTTVIKDPSPPPLLFPRQTTPPARRREETPIPIARTEVEEKLTLQGFIKMDKPIKFNDEDESFIRKKDPVDEEIDPNAPPKPPERRRSVKEIIESINRSQQLLKMNQPATPQFERKFPYGSSQKYSYHEKPTPPPKDNVLMKLQMQAESERQINELLADLEDFQKVTPPVEKTHKFPNATDDDVNGVIFEKCILRSDTNNNNVTDDDLERISRGDINPVPKPRRQGREAS